ncbi:MAG: terminase small subunit [Ruminococcus sp.]|nr:terminase small subunit [Candidatus Copronaster equi]
MALKEREKLFCLYFSETRNARTAANKAGFGILAKHNAVKLMAREDIKNEIERIDKTKLVSAQEVISGYRQLAFGSVADAMKLLFAEDNIDCEDLDLFNISEIKRPKTGGIEIKFFDRIKALEHLEELSNASQQDKALPFYSALEKSAAALKGDFDE